MENKKTISCQNKQCNGVVCLIKTENSNEEIFVCDTCGAVHKQKTLKQKEVIFIFYYPYILKEIPCQLE